MLNAVAAKIGWETTKPAAGTFRGIAEQMGYGSYTAAAAEVSVNERGKVKIDHYGFAPQGRWTFDGRHVLTNAAP